MSQLRRHEPERGGAEWTALARKIIDSSSYLTLATADGDGRPWASPVWYAPAGYREFLWVSRPDTRHSRNISVRSEVAIVIFDSAVAPGSGQAVYAEAVADELSGSEREWAIETYSSRSEVGGAGAWTAADVISPAPHRLYRARASSLYVLDGNDRRVEVEPW